MDFAEDVTDWLSTAAGQKLSGHAGQQQLISFDQATLIAEPVTRPFSIDDGSQCNLVSNPEVMLTSVNVNANAEPEVPSKTAPNDGWTPGKKENVL